MISVLADCTAVHLLSFEIGKEMKCMFLVVGSQRGTAMYLLSLEIWAMIGRRIGRGIQCCIHFLLKLGA